MNALSCPFKPVAQREVAASSVAHAHRYLADITLGNGLVVQDCGCGYRRRVRIGEYGDIVEVFDDGIVPGGSSLDNAVFLRDADGHFVDRWAPVS